MAHIKKWSEFALNERADLSDEQLKQIATELGRKKEKVYTPEDIEWSQKGLTTKDGKYKTTTDDGGYSYWEATSQDDLLPCHRGYDYFFITINPDKDYITEYLNYLRSDLYDKMRKSYGRSTSR